MKKRVLSIVLALALCLGLLPVGAWAASIPASAPAEETVSDQGQGQTGTAAEPDGETEFQTGDEVDPVQQAAWAELTSRVTVQAAPALAAVAHGGVTGAITRSAGGTTVTVIRDPATFTTLNVEFRAWTDASLPAVAFTPTVNGLDGAQFNVGSTPVSLLNLASGFGMNVVQDSDGVTYTFDFAAWEDRYGADPIDTLTYDDVESSGGTIYLFYRQNGEETDSGLVDVHLSLGGYPGDTQVPVTGTGKLVAGPINDTSALDALRRSDVAIPEGTTWGYHSAALRPKTGSGSLSVTSVRLVYGGLYYQVDSDMSSADSVLLPVSEYDLWIYYQRAYLLNVTIEGFDNKLGNTVNGSPLADNTYIFSVPENGFLDFSVGIASDSNAVVTNTTTDEVLFDSDRDGYEVKRFNYQFSGDRMQGGQSVTVEFKSVSTYLLEYSHYVDNPGVNQSYHGFSVMLNGTALSRDQRTIGIKKGDVLKFNSGGSNMTESYMVNTIVLNGTALNLPDFSWTRPASSGANVTTERNNVVLFDSAQNKMATVNITTRVNYAGSGNSSYPSQANNPNGTYTEVEFVEIYNNIKMNRANLAPKAYPDLIFYEIDEGLSGRIHNYNQSELIPGAAIYPMQASGENPSLVLDVEFGYYVTQLRMGDSDSISPQAGSTWYGDKNYYANNGGGPLAQQNYDKIMANPTNRGYLESELINFQFAYHNDLSNDSLNVQDGMAFTLPLDSTGQATNSSVVLAGDAGGATLLGWKLGINGSTVYYPGQTIPRADIVARQGGCVTYENTAGQATIHLYPVTTTTTGVGAPTMAQVTFHWGSSTHSINIAGLLEGSYLDRDTVMSISEVQNAIQGFVPDGYVLDPVISTSMLKLSAGGVSNNQFHLYFVVPSVLITFDSDYGFDVSGSNVMNTQYRHQQPGGAFSNLPIPWDDDTDNVVFVGWSTNQYATTGEDLTSATVPEADTIYYAVYVADLNNDDTPDRDEAQYSITFWAGTTESAITRQFPFAESGGSYEGLYKNLVANQLVNAQTTGFGVNFLVSTPNGYQFAGWEVNPTNGGDGNPIPTEWLPGPISGGPHGNLETSLPSTAPYATEVEFIMPASNVDFTAKWNVQITFESDHGFSTGTADGGYQTPGGTLVGVPTPADTSNDGVVFTNWVRSTTMSGNTTTTELTDDLTGETVPDGPTTYVAQYVTDSNNDGVPDGDQVTITFESDYGFEDENGNQVDGPISTLQTPGQTLVLPTPWDTEDDDVVFTGWSPDVVVGTMEVPSSDATYTAVYADDLNNDGTPDDTQEKYTVTFDPGIAGIFASMPSNQTDLVAGQPMTVTETRPSADHGYYFTGWSVEPSTLPTTAGESYTMPAQNVVFAALWDVDIYFESDHNFEEYTGHGGWSTIQTPGDLLEALTPIDTNSDGVVFVGWERETTTPSGVITTELSTDLSNERVPDGPSTYTAIYATDANNDGIPDSQQVRITFEVVLASGATVPNPGFQEWNYGTEHVNEGATQIISLQKPGEELVVPHAVETPDDNLTIVGWDPVITEGATMVPSSATTYILTLGPDLNNDGTPDDQENHYSITFDPGIAADEFGPEFPWPADIYTDLVAGQPINLITGWDLNEPVGYRITGWTVSPANDYNDNPIPTGFMPNLGHQDGSTEVFYPLEGVNFLMPASDVVFTAQWDVEITFTSAYGLNGDGASTSISSYQTPGETMAGIPTPVDTDSDGVVFTGWQPSVSTGDVVPTAPTTYTAQYADDLNNDGVADEAQVTITFVSEHGFVNAGASMQRIDTLQSPGGPLNIADTPLDTDSDGVVFVGWNTDQNATTGTSLSGESVPSMDTTYYAIYKDDTNNDGTEDERQVTVTFTITGNSNGFQAFTYGGQSWPQGEDTIETLQTPGDTLSHPNGVQSTGDNIAEIGWNPPLDATVPAGGGSYTLEYGADLNNNDTPDDQENEHYSITFDPGIVDGVPGFEWHMMSDDGSSSNTAVTPFSSLVAGQPVDFVGGDTRMIVPDSYEFTGWTVIPASDHNNNSIPTDWWPYAIDGADSNLVPPGAMYWYDVSFVMPAQDVVFTAQWDVEITFESDRGFDDETGTSVSSYQTPGETLSNVPTPTDTTSDGVVFVGWNTDENATTGTDLRSEQVGTVPTTYYAIYATDDNNDGTPDGTQVEITFVVTGNPNGFQAFTHGGQSWDAGVDTITTLQTPGERLEHPEGVESTGDNIVMIGWSPELETNVPTSGGSYTLEYGPDLNNNGVLDGEENFSITYQAGTVGSAVNLPASVTVAAGSSQAVEDNVPTAANWLFTGWSVTPEEDYEGNPMPTRAGDSFTMPLSNVTFTAQWTADTNGDGVPDEDQVQITFHLDGNPNGFSEFIYGGQTWPAGTTTDIVTLQTPGQNLAYPQGVETPNDDIAMVGWTPSITSTTDVPNENTTYTLTYEADLNNDNTPDSGERQYTVRYDAGIATGVASLNGMPAQVTGLVAGQPMTVPTDVPTADGYQFTGWRVDVTSVPTAAGQSYEMPAQDVTFTAQWDVQIRFYSLTGFVEGTSGEVFFEGGYQTPGDVLTSIPTPIDTNSDGVVFNTWNPPIISGTTVVPSAPQIYAAAFVTDANNDGVADGSQVTITFTISGNDKGFDTFTYGSQRWEAGRITIETLQTPGTALAHPEGVESVGDNIASEEWSPELPANVPNENTTYTLTYSADENNDGTPDSDETKYSITYLEGSGPSTVAGMPTGATGLLAGSSQMVAEEEPTATGWLFLGWSVTPTQDYANNSMPTTGGTQFQMPRENVTFTAQWAEDINGDGVPDEDQVAITFVISGNTNGFEAFNHGTQSWREGVTRIETLQTPGTALAHPEGVESANDNIALVGWNPEITASTVVPNDPTTYTLEYGADENNDGTPDSDEDRYSITYLGGDVSGAVRLPETQTGLLAGTSQTVSSTVPTTIGWIFTGWSVTPTQDYANSPMPTIGGESFLMPESDVVFTAQWTADANGDGVPDEEQVTITFTIDGNTAGFGAFRHGTQSWEEGVLSIQTLQTPNDVLAYPAGVEHAGDGIALVGWNPSIDGSTRVPTSDQSYTLVYGPDANNNDEPDEAETKYSIIYSAGTTVTGAGGLPSSATNVLSGTTQTVASEEPTATGWIFIGWTVSPAEDYAGNTMPTIGGESFLMPESDVVFTAQWTEDANGDGVPDSDQVAITFTISGNEEGFDTFTHGSQSWTAGVTIIETLQTPGTTLVSPTGVEYDGDNIAQVGWSPSLPSMVPSSPQSYELMYQADLNNDGTPDSEETKYTITYEVGFAGPAASNLPDPVANLVAGQMVSVSTQVPTAAGYEFTGWSVNVSGLPTTAGTEFAMPGRNVVFTAEWGVQITFDSDHGFVGETGNTVDGGFQIPGEILTGIPTPMDTDSDGVAFTGWLPAINESSTRVPNVSTTYVAQYETDENNDGIPDAQEQKYAVIYKEGSVSAPVTGMPRNVADVLAGSSQQVSSAAPEAEGYVFGGWSVYPGVGYDGNAISTTAGDTFLMPRSNVTFTAQWSQDANGDGIPDSEQVEITFTITGNPAGFDAFSHGSQNWSAGETTIVTYQEIGAWLVAPEGLESTEDNIAQVGWDPELPGLVPGTDRVYTLAYDSDVNNDDTPDSSETKYSVSYDPGIAGAAASGMPGTQSDLVAGQMVVVADETPTATGYRFTGWASNVAGLAERAGESFLMPGENVVFTAQWDVQITFLSSNGFDGESALSYDGGYQTPGQPLANIPTPRDIMTDRVVFTGWQPAIELGVTTVPAGPTVYIAQYSADENNDNRPDSEQVTITFYSEYGFVIAGAATKQIVTVQEPGAVLNIPDTPLDRSTDNVTFVGWNPDPDATDPITIPASVPAESVAYYAVYQTDENNNNVPDDQEGKFSIRYTGGIADEVTGLPATVQDVLAGSKQQVSMEQPTASGWIFTGWSVMPTSDGDNDPMPTTPGNSFTMPEQNVVFRAQWVEDANGDGVPDGDQVQLTFQSQYGFTNAGAHVTSIESLQTPGTVLTIPDSPLDTTADDVVFIGWQPGIDEGSTQVPDRAVTYIAVYEADANHNNRPDDQEEQYSVIYEAGIAGRGATGMPGNQSGLVAGQTVMVAQENPTAEGYQFIGWSVDVSGLPTMAGESFNMPGQDVVFTAQWEVRITFDSQSTGGFEQGSAPYQVYQRPGERLITPTPIDTDSDGVVFIGWDPAVSAGVTVVPDRPTTYTAQYATDSNNDNVPDDQEYRYTIRYVSGVAGTRATNLPDMVQDVLAGSTQTVSLDVPTADGYVFAGWNVFPATDYDGNSMPAIGGEIFRMPMGNVEFTALWSADTNGDGVPDEEQVEITFTITGNPAGFQSFTHGNQTWSAGETSITTLQTPGDTLAYPNGVDTAGDNVAVVGWTPEIPAGALVPATRITYQLVYGADLNNNNQPDDQENRFNITYLAGAASGEVSLTGMPNGQVNLVSGQRVEVSDQMPTATGYEFLGWSVEPSSVPTTPGSSFTMPNQNVVFTAQWFKDVNGDGVDDNQQATVTFVSKYGFVDEVSGAYVDGPIVTTQTIGELLDVPQLRAVPAGVNFHGWSEDPTANVGSDLSGIVVTADVTYYAAYNNGPQATQPVQIGTAVLANEFDRGGEPYTADLSSWFKDSDTSVLTYSYSGLTGGGSIQMDGSVLTYTPVDADEGTTVRFTVSATDGLDAASTEVQITVTRAAGISENNQILEVYISGQVGLAEINHGENGGIGSITVWMPTGTNISRLRPSIIHNGAVTVPLSDTFQNFSNGPVRYTVYSETGASKVYEVHVRVGNLRRAAPGMTFYQEAVILSQSGQSMDRAPISFKEDWEVVESAVDAVSTGLRSGMGLARRKS